MSGGGELCYPAAGCLKNVTAYKKCPVYLVLLLCVLPGSAVYNLLFFTKTSGTSNIYQFQLAILWTNC